MPASTQAPEGVHYYESLKDVPENIKKYWLQRQNIFSRYDEGVWLTDDAWFGVTPEPIANKIAEHVATADPSKTTLVDAFAGAGGNVIAFALSGRWKQIFAVEKDPKTLACARHNAEIYGVSKKIFWIEGDVFSMMKSRLKSVKNAVLFASPPWGGPSYTEWDVFDLNLMEPYGMTYLYDSFSKLTTDLVLYLPRTSDVRQLLKHTKNREEKLKVLHYCMHGASKALCVYYGSFQLEKASDELPSARHASIRGANEDEDCYGCTTELQSLDQNQIATNHPSAMDVDKGKETALRGPDSTKRTSESAA